jgi:aldehyde dehydrogenase (NAD+)
MLLRLAGNFEPFPIMTRICITKTPKCYVGGAFIRSESGRVTAWHDDQGRFVANMPQCTRKDLRNAVEAAAKAGAAWAKRSGYNRGQILYRLAEMLEARRSEMSSAIRLAGMSQAAADKEVAASIDRIVHYAGWTDKYEALLGSVNPVASAHFNFTVTEAMGVIGVIAADDFPLLSLLSLVLPVITSGNSVVALASTSHPYPAILLGEMLATSDLPGGVINILTGQRGELLSTFATHAHLRGLSAVATVEEGIVLQQGAAENVKRVKLLAAEKAIDWHADSAQGLYHIRDFIETKTTWHPVGV